MLRFAYSGVLLMTTFLKIYPISKIRNIPIYRLAYSIAIYCIATPVLWYVSYRQILANTQPYLALPLLCINGVLTGSLGRDVKMCSQVKSGELIMMRPDTQWAAMPEWQSKSRTSSDMPVHHRRIDIHAAVRTPLSRSKLSLLRGSHKQACENDSPRPVLRSH